MNVLALGASRSNNIGYLSSVQLLEQGATVTFLLRSPAVFHRDEVIQRFVKSGKVRLIQGDALKEADNKRAWDAAWYRATKISFSILKGIVITPHNIVAQCMLNLLCTMPTYPNAPQPKIIVISTVGHTNTAYAALPFLLKPVYTLLNMPRRDKAAMERVLAHCTGLPWPAADGEPSTDLTGADWRQRPGLPAAGTVKHVLVVRPLILTDGPCVADEVKAKGTGKAPYRTGGDEVGGYTISRKDTAHFVLDALSRWDEFENKRINIAY
ncbi:hypothetical protein C8R46DRAFT_1157150 [Mycena filopes]|nr:hypothetical protein C8R46DRAFT_1157150 [Mycena filopes]